MALGFSSKAKEADSKNDSEKTAENPEFAYDAENLGERRASRVAGVNRKDVAADDSSEDLTVGKQIELEAGNAIKYRTCSWQKVCLPYAAFRSAPVVLSHDEPD
jgi:hypothetical protein